MHQGSSICILLEGTYLLPIENNAIARRAHLVPYSRVLYLVMSGKEQLFASGILSY